jgi:hypothetical protein
VENMALSNLVVKIHGFIPLEAKFSAQKLKNDFRHLGVTFGDCVGVGGREGTYLLL